LRARRWLAIAIAIGLALLAALLTIPRRHVQPAAEQRHLLATHDYDGDGRPDCWDYDTDGDSQPDLWVEKSTDSTPDGPIAITVVKKDRNGDGKPDWIEETRSLPGSDKTPFKSISEDQDYDGQIDYSAVYWKGRKGRVVKWIDTDGDRRLDTRTVDSDGDRRIDTETRYYYLKQLAVEKGNYTDPRGFNYAETDVDMDGVGDIFEEYTDIGWKTVNQSLLYRYEPSS